jgi:general secretion pathway protein J
VTLRARSGFTLVELLIALAVLAVLAVLGYRAVATLSGTQARLAAEAEQWRVLDAFFARLEGDCRQALPRPVRAGDAVEPAWWGAVDARGEGELRFSRAGAEFFLEPGSAGQRIGYRLRDGVLEVMYWPGFDTPPGAAPTTYALAGGIAAFRLSYLDSRGAWRDAWPQPNEPPLPRAVRVGLQLQSGEAIERWLTLH